MLGLIIKDFLICKRYTRTIFLLVAFYSLFGFLQKDGGSAFVLLMTPLFFTMMTITTFAYDNAAKWDAYALSMPVVRGDIVFSKYAAGMLFSVAGTVLAFILTVLISLIKGEAFTQEFVFGALAALGASLVIISILLPLIYKFGIEKARLLMFVVFALPTVLGLILSKSGLQPPEINGSMIKILVILSPVLIIAVLGCSYLISNSIYAKKEL